MRIPRFYDPQTLTEGTHIQLSDDVVQHVSRALRMKPGDYIMLFNGDGFEYKTQLTHVEKRAVSGHVKALIKVRTESPLTINIGQCISRGERMDYAVQKSTEMGVRNISPLFSERCEVKLPKERQAKRINHWVQVSISACEQSGRVTPPIIEAPSTLENWLSRQEADIKLVLHHHNEQSLQAMTQPQKVALLIGPEGGLTKEEVELAIHYGFKPLTLGPRVMRTETAPVAALTLLNYLWGDLK